MSGVIHCFYKSKCFDIVYFVGKSLEVIMAKKYIRIKLNLSNKADVRLINRKSGLEYFDDNDEIKNSQVIDIKLCPLYKGRLTKYKKIDIQQLFSNKSDYPRTQTKNKKNNQNNQSTVSPISPNSPPPSPKENKYNLPDELMPIDNPKTTQLENKQNKDQEEEDEDDDLMTPIQAAENEIVKIQKLMNGQYSMKKDKENKENKKGAGKGYQRHHKKRYNKYRHQSRGGRYSHSHSNLKYYSNSSTSPSFKFAEYDVDKDGEVIIQRGSSKVPALNSSYKPIKNPFAISNNKDKQFSIYSLLYLFTVHCIIYPCSELFINILFALFCFFFLRNSCSRSLIQSNYANKRSYHEYHQYDINASLKESNNNYHDTRVANGNDFDFNSLLHSQSTSEPANKYSRGNNGYKHPAVPAVSYAYNTAYSAYYGYPQYPQYPAQYPYPYPYPHGGRYY